MLTSIDGAKKMATEARRVRRRKSLAGGESSSREPSAQVRGIEATIRAGVDVGETDKNGVTILHHAVRFRSPDAVRALIAMGANVNQACQRSGSTPLHRAVTSTGAPGTAGMQAEAREIVSLLLAAGADPSIRNRNGKTPGDYAADETIRALLTATKKERKFSRGRRGSNGRDDRRILETTESLKSWTMRHIVCIIWINDVTAIRGLRVREDSACSAGH
jgi:tankyrase